MQYYRIHESCDIKVIGRKFPQVEKSILPTMPEDPMFIGAFVFKKAPDNVLLPSGILRKSAKVTDMISSSGLGIFSIVISNKLYQIINNSHIGDVQFLKISIKENNGISHPYWLAHPYQPHLEMLNVGATTVGYYSDVSRTVLMHKSSAKDYKTLHKEVMNYFSLTKHISSVGYLCINNIVFREDMDIDFFTLWPVTGGIGFYVSEKLKNEIEAAGCTGMVFTATNEQYP